MAAEFPPSCEMGDLTASGAHELEQLGAAYRRYLVDSHFPFLAAGYIDPSELFVRVTSSRSTFQSAVSFFRGLYPPAMPDEVLQIMVGSPERDILRPASLFAKCQEFRGRLLADVFMQASTTVAASPLLRELFRVMDGALSGAAATKLSYFSVDNDAFGRPVPRVPGYHSQPAGLYPLHDFAALFRPAARHCPEMP